MSPQNKPAGTHRTPTAPAVTTRVRRAGDAHAVLSLEGGTGAYRRTPCGGCPWLVTNTGAFPAEAFAHSAETAYDMADRTFGCHESGSRRPSVCAGFLLRGAEHNLAVRLGAISGRFDLTQVREGDQELFADYRAMAIANGLDPDDPALTHCR